MLTTSAMSSGTVESPAIKTVTSASSQESNGLLKSAALEGCCRPDLDSSGASGMRAALPLLAWAWHGFASSRFAWPRPLGSHLSGTLRSCFLVCDEDALSEPRMPAALSAWEHSSANSVGPHEVRVAGRGVCCTGRGGDNGTCTSKQEAQGQSTSPAQLPASSPWRGPGGLTIGRAAVGEDSPACGTGRHSSMTVHSSPPCSSREGADDGMLEDIGHGALAPPLALALETLGLPGCRSL
mmetsp:Transcript_4897/g.11443  ORF Transcript_4897/g.11443 Transcript_4897/m.11443 type:complete len:239 (-) Transcript_4897:80-796(-)